MKGHTPFMLKYLLTRRHGLELPTELNKAAGECLCICVCACVLVMMLYSYRSWQTLEFDKCPVTFIKIVGTTNTANEVFHCVHFECPASGHGSPHDSLRYPLF